MTNAITNPGILSQGVSLEPREKRKLPVLAVAELLHSQATLTAVDRFARSKDGAHDADAPAQAKYYRDLIPLEHPSPGEQYAFEVDLDTCTGCKACVTACHTLNGLDPGEMWRSVGLLHGGTAAEPAQQTVTTSCHHCVDPACMTGCPVGAYEKSPITGIVKHLDDQCFGCQYCLLMCPYDAPKYNADRGIVRKCDMCSDRLAHGEAPACVQACPNEAISIRIVSHATVIQTREAGDFLLGAPDPEQTLPTTVYKTSRTVRGDMLPADYHVTSPEHSHLALVIMLTLTQLAAGSFGLGALIECLWGRPAGDTFALTSFASIVVALGLGTSVFHLGRPWLFWRVLWGLRTSWLSREALVFGVFAALTIGYEIVIGWGGDAFREGSRGSVSSPLRGAAAIAGALGVFASMMVYVATRRQQWSAAETGVRFFGTTVVLGAAAVLAVGAFSGMAPEGVVTSALAWCVAGATAMKLVFEASGLRHRNDTKQTAAKRVAVVMVGDLRTATGWRFGLGAVGGLAMPLVVATGSLSPIAFRWFAVFVLGFLVAAEGLERYLFFRAAPASRMPGGLR